MANKIWNLPSDDCHDCIYYLHAYSSKIFVKSFVIVKALSKGQIDFEI